MLHRLFRHILYTDDVHSYFNLRTDNFLSSVTREIKKITPEFKSHFWLTYKAYEKLGYNVLFNGGNQNFVITEKKFPFRAETVEPLEFEDLPEERQVAYTEVKEQWKEDSEQGLSKGSDMHDYLQHGVERRLMCSAETIRQKQILAFIKDYYLSGKWDIEHTEFVVGNDFLGGMIDNLSITSRSRRLLIDYKSDKDIDMDNPFDSMLPPYDHLPDCAYTKYSIQTSCYRLFLEREGITVHEQMVAWFNDDNPSYKLIRLRYYKNIAKDILDGKYI